MENNFIFGVLVNYYAAKVRLFLILSREKLIYLKIFLDSLCPIRQQKSGNATRIREKICNFAVNMSDIATELVKLHTLSGAAYSKQVERIARTGLFHPVEGEQSILSAIGEGGKDYESLLNAARKAVSHGYRVYLLPNPSGTRTPDFIFERKGTFRPYDLKTITGKASVSNRLEESIGQSNRVLINITNDYNPSLLARSIRHYFERNVDAIEVLVFKGGKSISVSRELSQSKSFYGIFMKKYSQ